MQPVYYPKADQPSRGKGNPIGVRIIMHPISEYLDLKQLTKSIPFSKSLIEELIAKGILVEGIHFRRPTGPGGKRVFFWSAIEKWLKGQDFDLRAKHVSQNQRRDNLPGFQT